MFPMTETAISPAQSALLLADFQPAVLGSLPSGPDAVLAGAEAALAGARAAGLTVAHVRVAFAEDDFGRIPPANKMFAPVAAAHYLGADAPETQFSERVTPVDSEIVVRKTRVGAFSTTDLHEQLQARGVTTLVLAGVSTAGVVLSTVRAAADLDYEVIVLADACADHDPEVHALLTQRVFPVQATVLDQAQFLAAIGR
jgi:nicotinamidase-related amidase